MPASEYDQLQGRIIALELTVQALVTQAVMDVAPDPVAHLRDLHGAMFQSMQNLQPVGGLPTTTEAFDQSDRIWAAAVDALNMTFSNVEKRITSIIARG